MAESGDDEGGLRFFNSLSGRLHIGLSEPAVRVSERLLNLKAPPSARIEEVSFSMQVLEETGEGDDLDFGDPRDLTKEEWRRVVLRSPAIRMRGENDKQVVEHRASDGAAFTVRDLAAAIAETERQTRGGTLWDGGIDVHHIYFEGIELEGDGVWFISWGS
jgi:hypothetical protein